MDRIDSRTKIGRTVDFLYKILWDFIGDENVPALMLIDSIVFKRMQMLFLESQHTDKPIKDFPKVYLSLNNSFRKDLQALAQFAPKPEPPDLSDYIKEVYGKNDKK